MMSLRTSLSLTCLSIPLCFAVISFRRKTDVTCRPRMRFSSYDTLILPWQSSTHRIMIKTSFVMSTGSMLSPPRLQLSHIFRQSAASNDSPR